VLLVLVEMATWFAPKGDQRARRGCLAALLTRPLVAVLLLFLPCILLVRCDLGGTDVPDIITTTALLCALGYGLFVLPIAFVALTLRLARWLWRFGQRSSFRSGLVAGVGAVVGALLPTCMVCTPPDHEADDPNEPFTQIFERGIGHLGDEIDRKGLMEGSLSGLADAATVIPGTTGPWKLPLQEPPLDSRLRSCVERLHRADQPRSPPSSEPRAGWSPPPRRSRHRQRRRLRHRLRGLPQARARGRHRRPRRVLLAVRHQQLLQGPRAQRAGPVQRLRHPRRPLRRPTLRLRRPARRRHRPPRPPLPPR
jgi:hypothetical protein